MLLSRVSHLSEVGGRDCVADRRDNCLREYSCKVRVQIRTNEISALNRIMEEEIRFSVSIRAPM